MPQTGTLRQRTFAWALARFNTKYERFAEQYKQQLFSELSGTVLEIGPGAGANLRYLARPNVRWIGVEPNPFMAKYLKEQAMKLGIKIEIRPGKGFPSSAHKLWERRERHCDLEPRIVRYGDRLSCSCAYKIGQTMPALKRWTSWCVVTRYVAGWLCCCRQTHASADSK